MLNINTLIKKYRESSNVVKASIWFVFCSFLLKGISFISAPIFTRILSAEEYGKLAVYTSYEQLLLIFSTWEMYLGAYQKGIYKYQNDLSVFTSSIQLLINIITVIFFTLVLIFSSFFQNTLKLPFNLLGLFFVYYIVYPSYNCWIIRKRSAYEYKAAVFATLLYSILGTLIPVIALLLIKPTSEIKLGATLIVSICICCVSYIPNADYWNLREKWDRVKRYWRYAISYTAPLVLHSLSYLILAQADRIMISQFVGDAQAAYYSVAYNLASTINLIQNSIEQSLLPWRYQKLNEQKYEDIRKVTNVILLVVGTFILAFILIAPDIMGILFTANYHEAIWCLPPISASVYFMLLYSIFVSVETYYEQTNCVMYVSVICSVLNILFNYFGIKMLGYIACAYTTLICYILFAVGHYYFAQKILHKNGINNIFDGRIVLFISGMVLGLSILFTYFYSFKYVRYGLVIIIIIFFLLFKKEIIKLYEKIKK